MPNLLKPKEMLGFHENGAETGDFFRTINMVGPSGSWEKVEREGGEGEVEVQLCGCGEDGLGESGGGGWGGCGDCPADDIELGRGGQGQEAGVGGEALVEIECGLVAGF